MTSETASHVPDKGRVADLWGTRAFVGGQMGKFSTHANDTRQHSVGGWTELHLLRLKWEFRHLAHMDTSI